MTPLLLAAYFVLFCSVAYVSYFILSRLSCRLAQDRSILLGIFEKTDENLPRYRRALETAVHYLAAQNRKLNLRGYPEWMERYIQSAGDPWRMDAYEILAVSELSFISVASALFFLLFFLFQSLNVFLPLVLGALAAMVPQYMISGEATRRLGRINRKLPFALDLMILSMEAGSSFLESIAILVTSDPKNPLAQEFNQVLQSIQHGKTRREALSDMARRVKSDDLGPIIQAINTGEEMGTPVGKILRVQAESLRLKRTQRAEKLAGEASSKILFPSLLIMVAVLLMLLGPVLLNAIREGWL